MVFQPRCIVTKTINVKSMDKQKFIATAQITINGSLEMVWDALVNPDVIKKYMFGTTVCSDWKVGSKITWKGDWKGKTYEDKGEIKEVKPKEKLSYSHYSPLTGKSDIPENYHRVTVKLESVGKQTKVTLSQDNNASQEDQKHSEENWALMLSEMKKILEKKAQK